MSRIYGKKVNLNNNSVLSFFKGRAQTKTPTLINKVIYQDNNPELAAQRDEHEKNTIIPLLALDKSDDVLDIGCGVGRWASSLIGKVSSYYGTDFCEEFIDIARSNISSDKTKVTFQVLPAQSHQRENLLTKQSFSVVLISGVLLYLNDDQLRSCLSGVASLVRSGARIYLREPIAIQERLTLDEFFSEELKSSYHAIYRTDAELKEMMTQAFTKDSISLIQSKYLFPEILNNRKETSQKFYIWRKN